MQRHFTLEFWVDDGWHVGRIKEIPGVFSQGESLEELEENIKDAYRMVMKEEAPLAFDNIQTKDLELEV